MVEIRWLNEAKGDLKDIYDYISTHLPILLKKRINQPKTKTFIKLFDRCLILITNKIWRYIL